MVKLSDVEVMVIHVDVLEVMGTCFPLLSYVFRGCFYLIWTVLRTVEIYLNLFLKA